MPQVLASPHHHADSLALKQDRQVLVLLVVPVPGEAALVGLGGKGDFVGVRERVTVGVGELEGTPHT